jgi:hypothetical protein
VSGLPVIWKMTSTARPFLEISPAFPAASGDLIAPTDGVVERRRTRSPTAAR